MGRILHLSDIHFGAENKAAVEAAAAFSAAGDFDLIAITGDITQFGHHDEFANASVWVKALPHPVLITPGNHDTPYVGVAERLVAPFIRFERAFGPAWAASHESAGLAARAFNTARGVQLRLNWSKGEAFASHARKLAAGLAAARPGTLRAALCHHPLMEVVGGPMTGRVRGGRAASAILAAGKVDVVLSGHVHTPFALPLPCEDGHTYAVGAGTLSTRERGMPAGFNVVEWDDQTITVTAQGWTGSHYEPLRTWALPRRTPQA